MKNRHMWLAIFAWMAMMGWFAGRLVGPDCRSGGKKNSKYSKNSRCRNELAKVLPEIRLKVVRSAIMSAGFATCREIWPR